MSALLVPLDGSPVAESALAMALAIARNAAASLHLVQVRGMTLPSEADEDPARDYMEEMAARVRTHAPDVAAVLIPAEPPKLLQPTPPPSTIARQLAEYGAKHGVVLVVMTTHGRGGFSRRWFGSVAEAMLRESRAPVLLVRASETASGGATLDEPPLERVLVATAHDDDAYSIVSAAQRFTRPFDPHYTLLRVLRNGADEDCADVADPARLLRSENVDVVTPVQERPATVILQYAAEHHIDLIILGTHARTGLDRLLLGSVADKVVRGADCSVLVVPPRA